MSRARAALQVLREAADDGRLDSLCAEHGVRLLTVFGSAADPDVTEPGDLDVAVLMAEDATDVVRLLDDLMALTGFSDVDLMDLRRAGPVAREAGLTQCVPLFEAEEFLFAREQLRAIQERLDTAWLREIELRRLAG